MPGAHDQDVGPLQAGDDHGGSAGVGAPARCELGASVAARRRVRQAGEALEQPIDERGLGRVQPVAGLAGSRPDHAVDLGNAEHRPRSWAARSTSAMHRVQRVGIEVALDRPAMDDLAGAQPDLAQVDRRSVGRPVTELLLELPSRGVEQLLPVVDRALGQTPGSLVAALPDRPARMRDEQLERVIAGGGTAADRRTALPSPRRPSCVGPVPGADVARCRERMWRAPRPRQMPVPRTRGTTKRPKEPYRTGSPATLPSKLGPVAAAPVSNHLVSLAAIVAAARGPGSTIARRSGVGATGPFGQDRTISSLPPTSTTGLSTNLRGRPAKLSTIHRHRG